MTQQAKIRNGLATRYRLPYGDVLAHLGVGNTDDRYLFDGCYGEFINVHGGAEAFLEKFGQRYQDRDLIERLALEKLTQLRQTLLTASKKYSLWYTVPTEATAQKDAFKALGHLYGLAQHLPLGMPVCNGRITSGFGLRKHPIDKHKKMHSGLDITAPKQAKIFASANGQVTLAAKVPGYGNLVILKHGDKLTSSYAHLASVAVTRGQKVLAGQEIGIQGRTGKATSDHLHFEIRAQNKPINPLEFIKPAGASTKK